MSNTQTVTQTSPSLLWSERLGLASLWTMAVAQPLFTGVFKDGSFAVEHHLSQPEFISIVLSIAWVPPFIALIALFITNHLSPKLARFLYALSIAVLIALLVLLGLKHWYAIGFMPKLALAFTVGVVASILVNRYNPLKDFLGFLAPAILFFPALALWHALATKSPEIIVQEAPSSAVAEEDSPETTKPIKSPPVVMIIFDEFPIRSLLTTDGDINATRYPNFARLAQQSHWFKNTVSVHNSTGEAVPAILTGNYPPKIDKDQCLVRPVGTAHFENTLFSALDSYYDFFIRESFIELSSNSNLTTTPESAPSRNYLNMAREFARTYVFYILTGNPEVDFEYYKLRLQRNGGALADEVHTHGNDVAMFEALNTTLNANKPSNTFYFIHPLLPHYKWDFYPSGKHYGSWPVIDRTVPACQENNSNPFCQSSIRFALLQQRHQLQVGYTDYLLGTVLDKLETEQMLDDALIVVTADHGVSIGENKPLREASESNLEDIMLVPLFIKTPQQKKAVIHRNVAQSIDILPSIADVLNVNLTNNTDGTSLFSETHTSPTEVGICSPNQWLTISSEALLTRQAQAIRNNPFSKSLYNTSPFKGIVGQSITKSSTSSDVSVVLYTKKPNPNEPVPLHWFGEIKANNSKHDKQTLFIAAVQNNTLVAATQSYAPFTSSQQLFDLLLPEEASQQSVELFEVQGPLESPTFKRINAIDTFPAK